MSRRKASDPARLVTDPGVLDDTPTLEVFDCRAVAAVGGTAVLPHRGRWLRASEAGLAPVGWFDETGDDTTRQAVVHLQKGREATEEGFVEAWNRLERGGRLLLVGGNELGVKSAVKRLSAAIDGAAAVLANRARARVAAWTKIDLELSPPAAGTVAVEAPGDRFELGSAPGVFSADAVDPGTAMLLTHLDGLGEPESIFDPGCGLGVLGLAALRRWPSSRAVLADVDRRAVSIARGNAASLGLGDRCEVRWWDAVAEPAPDIRTDLALVNPPFHSGVPVDLQPARAIFRAIGKVLRPGGRALVVANRTLPWERDLREIGRLRQLRETGVYKVLELSR